MEQLRTHQHDRLASQTTEERDTRLEQLSAHQCDELASQTTKERKARLEQLHLCHDSATCLHRVFLA